MRRNAGCALLLLSWIAQAQTPKPPVDLTQVSVEDLMKIEVESVYSASRYLQKATEAPAAVTVVTAAEIKRFGYRTLAGILRSVRGFYVSYDRNYSYVGVRGFGRPGDYNTRVLLMIDGHRMNENIYDGAYIGTEFLLDVDLIERVEIVRGPSSSLYGANAFFGVINVITKKGVDLKGLEMSAEAGSFGTARGHASYGTQFRNGLDLLFSTAFFDSAGPRRLFFPEFNEPSTNNGVAERADDDSFRSALVNLSFRNFFLQGGYVTREKGIPTGSFGAVFNDPRTRTFDKRGYLDLRYEREFAANWGLMARAGYDRYRYEGTYLYDLESGTPRVTNKDFGNGDWWTAEVKVSRKIREKHRLTLGAEYRDNLRQDQINYNRDPFFSYLDSRRNSRNWALYAQGEFHLTPRVLLNVGLRHDEHQFFGGTSKPRAGLIYNPFRQTTLKLLYGEAFRAPNVYELFYSAAGIGSKSNPNQNPETIRTYELVLEQYLGKRFRISASGYNNGIKGLISQTTDPVDGQIYFRNAGQVTARGLELELEGRTTAGAEGRASYSLQRAKDGKTNRVLTNSPGHMAQLKLGLPLARKALQLGLEINYMGARKTLAGNEAPGFTVANLTLLTLRLPREWQASFSVYNLLDQAYSDPGGEEHRQDVILQDGRSLRCKLTYAFHRPR